MVVLYSALSSCSYSITTLLLSSFLNYLNKFLFFTRGIRTAAPIKLEPVLTIPLKTHEMNSIFPLTVIRSLTIQLQ